MRTIRPGSSSVPSTFSASDDLDAALRAMGIRPNRRRRAALISWTIFDPANYVSSLTTTSPSGQERGHRCGQLTPDAC